jgi:Zn-finger nucleic acid-binding protein
MIRLHVINGSNTMRCPNDQSELTVRDTEGHIGFLCPTCKGAWLPANYVQSIAYMRDFSYADFAVQLSKSTTGSSQLGCPSGCGLLDKVNHCEVTLHWCRTCQGVWFDRGEIARLLAKFQLREKGAAEVVAEQVGWSILGALIGSLFS